LESIVNERQTLSNHTKDLFTFKVFKVLIYTQVFTRVCTTFPSPYPQQTDPHTQQRISEENISVVATRGRHSPKVIKENIEKVALHACGCRLISVLHHT
jgi:hypothetical protein